MKISEMNNDQATEALIRLATPFENICNDADLISSLEEMAGMEHEPMIKTVGKVLKFISTIGFVKHKQDLYEIAGALTLTPTGKVGQMNFKETLSAIQESYDDILRDFFTSSAIARRIRGKK